MEMSSWTLLFLLLVVSPRGNAGECQQPNLPNELVLSDSALLQNNFPDGSEITLECANGHKVDKGSNVIRCLNGEWSKEELICKKKDCGNPRQVQHVKYEIKSGTLFGSYIRPFCDPGYNFQGSSRRQCLSHGWTGSAACLVVTCGTLPVIPHSTILSQPNKTKIEYNDVIQYGCEKKYSLVGNSSVVCQENRKYSSLPQCKADCAEPVLKGSMVLKKTNSTLNNAFPHGSEVTLECAAGHVKYQGSDVITCNNGEWNKQELSCKAINCGKPPEIPHSIKHSNLTKENLEYKDEIEYSCEAEYTLVGNKFVVCQKDGKYSSLPQCKAINCGKPPEIPHSIKHSNLTKEILEYKDEIEYSCEAEYTLVGNKFVVCQKDGKYSSLPQCKAINCGKPPEIPHSIKHSNLTKEILEYKDEIEYSCEAEYTLVGNKFVVCQKDGKYSSLPQCKAINCGEPPEIPHSIKHSNLTKEILEYKDEIEYSCEAEYTLVGNKFVVCQKDGKYSSLPQCKADCPEPVLKGPVVLKNSPTLNKMFLHGSEVTLECATGKIQGSNSITCNNGKWNKQELRCEKSEDDKRGTFFQDTWIFKVVVVVFGVIALVFVFVCIWLHQKQKGSYDTREEKRMKEGLMQENSYSTSPQFRYKGP
ncbi:sushi, von Willebrand factor type A, EGF and pentraxin domain-containing protein 1-like isoform X2 [Silurus meridionalis]|uniref:sushi, von Willebrand factor type A, EGF and pentraxin domain-containing protein 1-like isoform X2 n=1 Tax=Silurus meridionalis TaxID=175797 RepID=UPI001EEB51F7|nr:sushi, von Willebrand factor type A, EGF and pentraxin domain-containing protein 1-like isoform X2 [Silurus meridionalis]